MSGFWLGVVVALGSSFVLLVVGLLTVDLVQSVQQRKAHLGPYIEWDCPVCFSRCGSKSWPFWFIPHKVWMPIAQRQVRRDHQHFPGYEQENADA